MKILLQTFCFCLFVLALTGCATMFSGSTQKINVKVVDSASGNILDGAICTVTDGTMSQHTVAGNPGIVMVQRGSNGVSFSCKKEGYKQSNTLMGDSFNALTVLNVVFWPGLIVDGLSGAYKKFPSHYVVAMEKL
ncbi:MAG: hypothetical protein SFT91_02960 [Rickettsiaceae bacterium]|nr:hypothetical protein [Rickettsiaceae bacterium]